MRERERERERECSDESMEDVSERTTNGRPKLR